MSYTINPNAKNKWVRNADNTMDLSIETDASSVYLDNGRTLEQEVGKGTMISNVVTVDSSMEKVVEGTYDGTYESCKMYGKNLVNVINYNDSNINTSGKYVQFNSMVWDIIGKTITIFNYSNKIVRTQMSKNGAYYRQLDLEPNTKTLVKLESDEKLERIRGMLANEWTLDEVGLNELKTSTMILEGDYVNQDIPYFEGLCDAKMPILRNTGKNLFDGNLEDGAFNSSGIPVEYKNRKRTGFIKIKQGETYTISGCTIARWCFYTPEKEFITTNTTQTTKPAPMDGYIRFSIQTNFAHDNIQLEESSSATSYEDHKTNILTTPDTVTLRSLPNGVRDELNLNTGEYIKRIGEVVLDGVNYKIAKGVNNTDGTKRFDANFTFEKFVGTNDWVGVTIMNSSVICDKAICINGQLAQSVHPNRTAIASYNGIPVLFIEDKTILTIEKANEWLQQNPITVQYELAEPITTIVESLTTPFAYQNGHVILESGYEGQSLLPTLEYSTVINKTGQIESVAKTIQRQEKQLTMLEQMLIQNIINLDYNNTLLALKNEMEEML